MNDLEKIITEHTRIAAKISNLMKARKIAATEEVALSLTNEIEQLKGEIRVLRTRRVELLNST